MNDKENLIKRFLRTKNIYRLKEMYLENSNDLDIKLLYANLLLEFSIDKQMLGLKLLLELLNTEYKNRALILLDCGVDFIIDCLLCRSSNNVVAHNIYKNLSGQQYENLQRKIVQTYLQQAQLNIQS